MKAYRIIGRTVLLMSLMVIAALYLINFHILFQTRRFMITGSELPTEIGHALVLGTNPLTRQGNPNPFFYGRLHATEELIRENVIDQVVLSGDGSFDHYNEPYYMKTDLLDRGVPASVLFLDPAGTRTLYSIQNAGRRFGEEPFVIISQEFHLSRAIYIARRLGLRAFGFPAADVTGRIGRSVLLREFFARAVAYFELCRLMSSLRKLPDGYAASHTGNLS
jgi:SanA protein